MPFRIVYPFRPSGLAWGLFPQAKPFGQPFHSLAAGLVEREPSGLVHIAQYVSLADSEHANLVYQDSVLGLGRRCKAVASQACLDLGPNTALPKVLPVAESLADLVGMSGHVVLDHGLNDGAGIAQCPAPLVVATAAFHRDCQVSGNGHQNGFKDGHFLDLLASVGIGGRIDLPALGLDSFLPLNFGLAQVIHGGRRSSQNVLAKGVTSHCNIPFQVFSGFPGGFLEYRILQGERNVNTFFQIFLKNFFGTSWPGEIVENGNKPTPGVGFTHCDILFFWAWMDLEKSIHEIKI